MGRPRKRQATGKIKDTMADLDLNQHFPSFDSIPFDNTFTIDPYNDAAGFTFANTITGQLAFPPEQPQAKGLCTVDDGRVVFHFGDHELNNPIDFGAEDTISDGPSLSTGSTISAVSSPPDVEKFNFLGGNQPAASDQGPLCSCLPSMYLAMSSLQELPSDVETALATVRAAANTTQASIRCEKCGAGVITEQHPPIEAFQNTMLLGTILPIIVNGYKRLLVMVDEETHIARATGAKRVFSLMTYGGICGQERLCGNAKHLEGAAMEPTEWRSAVRGLLRADVYGIEGVTPGLKGIISEMEHRQRTRHAFVDLMAQQGLSPEEIDKRKCSGEKDMLCLRILDTAKFALDSLIIA